jgi:D-glycero-alpha-D-manno-heptose 1-phosphate guanylyltransferase
MLNQTCVILAGGLGTRLQQVTNGLPKCMVPVREIPFIVWQMEYLNKKGFNRFILALGYGSKVVSQYLVGKTFNYKVDTITETYQLGTGGALLNAFVHFDLDECIVINGDTFIDADIREMFRPLGLENNETVRLAGIYTKDRQRFGGLDMNGDKLVGFVEKGVTGPGLISAGIYRVSRNVFDERKLYSTFSMENDILVGLVAKGKVGVSIIHGDMVDIGTVDDYIKFNARS